MIMSEKTTRVVTTRAYWQREAALAKGGEITAEQAARDMLERIGVENAQSFTAGNLVELANLIAAQRMITRDKIRMLRSIAGDGNRPPADAVAVTARGWLHQFADALERYLPPEGT